MKVKVLNRLPDTPIIKAFSNSKLNNNDKSSDPVENNNYMCDNQVYGLTTEIKEQFYVIKKSMPTLQTNRNNKTIKKL